MPVAAPSILTIFCQMSCYSLICINIIVFILTIVTFLVSDTEPYVRVVRSPYNISKVISLKTCFSSIFINFAEDFAKKMDDLIKIFCFCHIRWKLLRRHCLSVILSKYFWINIPIKLIKYKHLEVNRYARRVFYFLISMSVFKYIYVDYSLNLLVYK